MVLPALALAVMADLLVLANFFEEDRLPGGRFLVQELMALIARLLLAPVVALVVSVSISTVCYLGRRYERLFAGIARFERRLAVFIMSVIFCGVVWCIFWTWLRIFIGK
jgi:hypothetical protein